MHLGYGRDDRFADAHRVFAGLLPAARVASTPGGHDWPAWSALWQDWLARGLLQPACAARMTRRPHGRRCALPCVHRQPAPRAWALQALADAVAAQRSGLQPLADPATPLATWVGTRGHAWCRRRCLPALAAWDSRPTRLAWQALQQDGFVDAVAAARTRWGAARVGLVLGTSASTIGDSEAAYRHLDADGGFPASHRNPRLNTPHALAAFVQQALALEGPAVTVSTACSSSAKAFASARTLAARRRGRRGGGGRRRGAERQPAATASGRWA